MGPSTSGGTPDDSIERARAILERNRYMTLATADRSGRPWASPVWFAHRDCREFFWVSRPEARHSRNLAARAELALVVFDSGAAPSDVRALYASAVAEEVPGPELAAALGVYSSRSAAQGLPGWTVDDVTGTAQHRVYSARAEELFLLREDDRREPVPLFG